MQTQLVIPPLVAYYDFKQAPITFDFTNFIVSASALATMQSRMSFDLVLIADDWRKVTPRELAYTDADRQWRLWNLINQIVQVVPNLGDFTITRRPIGEVAVASFPTFYHPHHTPQIPYLYSLPMDAHKAGANVRAFRPSAHALKIIDRMFPDQHNLVTLTMRKAGHDATRDSNLDAWLQFYRELKAKGFRPIIVPDQDDTLDQRTIARLDWEVFESASMSVDLRLALYTRSRMNYLTNNGIIGILLFSQAPFCWYSVIVEGTWVASPQYYENMGISVGSKFPWLDGNQHMFWKPDTLENLRESLVLLPQL